MLDDNQRRAWDRDGFVVLPGFKSADDTLTLRRRAEAIVDSFDPKAGSGVFSTRDTSHQRERWFLDSGDAVRCFFEEEAFDAEGRLVVDKRFAINKIGHAMHRLDPVFERFSMDADIAALVAALGVERPRLWQSMYIFKQPRIGGEVRWHQDATYLIAEPLPVVGLWFALEDATRDNGCLWMAPGQHRSPLRERFERAPPGSDTTRMVTLDATPWPSEADALALEVEAGTVVALHGLMPHASAPNRSAVSRHAYTLHFSDGRSSWSPSNWLKTASPCPLDPEPLPTHPSIKAGAPR